MFVRPVHRPEGASVPECLELSRYGHRGELCQERTCRSGAINDTMYWKYSSYIVSVAGVAGR